MKYQYHYMSGPRINKEKTLVMADLMRCLNETWIIVSAPSQRSETARI